MTRRRRRGKEEEDRDTLVLIAEGSKEGPILTKINSMHNFAIHNCNHSRTFIQSLGVDIEYRSGGSGGARESAFIPTLS